MERSYKSNSHSTQIRSRTKFESESERFGENKTENNCKSSEHCIRNGTTKEVGFVEK